MQNPIDRVSRVHVWTLAAVIAASCAGSMPARAQTTPQDSSSPQPTLPASGSLTTSPVVDSIVGRPQPALEVHKRPMHATRRHVRHYARARPVPLDLNRPALAGVELLVALPPPGQPPHIVVPAPDYALDTIAAAFLTPAPPIICHDVRRDPDLPDPRLYRERTVACQPDNP